jgi:hypothetical protein
MPRILYHAVDGGVLIAGLFDDSCSPTLSHLSISFLDAWPRDLVDWFHRSKIKNNFRVVSPGSTSAIEGNTLIRLQPGACAFSIGYAGSIS